MVTIKKNTKIDQMEWDMPDRVYVCRAWFTPDDDGGFTVIAAKLPGVISEGDTENEAMENIIDAFRESILSYQEDEIDVPWEDVDPGSEAAFMLSEMVHV